MKKTLAWFHFLRCAKVIFGGSIVAIVAVLLVHGFTGAVLYGWGKKKTRLACCAVNALVACFFAYFSFDGSFRYAGLCMFYAAFYGFTAIILFAFYMEKETDSPGGENASPTEKAVISAGEKSA